MKNITQFFWIILLLIVLYFFLNEENKKLFFTFQNGLLWLLILFYSVIVPLYSKIEWNRMIEINFETNLIKVTDFFVSERINIIKFNDMFYVELDQKKDEILVYYQSKFMKNLINIPNKDGLFEKLENLIVLKAN